MMSYVDQLQRIALRCQQFLGAPKPLYKALPEEKYDAIDRVRVRHRRAPAFYDVLRQVTGVDVGPSAINVFTQPVAVEHHQTFYVFPTDGVKAIWSIHEPIEQSLHGLMRLKEVVSESEWHGAVEQYLSQRLNQSLQLLTTQSTSQALLYNIPDFYVVRTDQVTSYDDLIEAIEAVRYTSTL